mgnify:CR=1 FL=1|jgi:hypothetical protein
MKIVLGALIIACLLLVVAGGTLAVILVFMKYAPHELPGRTRKENNK